MPVVNRRQVRLLRRQIREKFGKLFIPTIDPGLNIRLGNVYSAKRNWDLHFEGDEIPKEIMKSSVQKSVSRNYHGETDKSVKLSGSTMLDMQLASGKTGLEFNFKSNEQAVILLRNTQHKVLSRYAHVKNYILDTYSKDMLSPRIFVVSEVLVADQYFVQFGGEKGGSLGVVLNVSSEKLMADSQEEHNAKISATLQKNVGYSLDGRNGGILGYRLSKIRLREDVADSDLLSKIRKRVGHDEDDVLVALSATERSAIANDGGFVLMDETESFVFNQEEQFA